MKSSDFRYLQKNENMRTKAVSRKQFQQPNNPQERNSTSKRSQRRSNHCQLFIDNYDMVQIRKTLFI